MSEIKFACPHCSQHIACDEIYCGEGIGCPGCGRALFVPPLAAFIPLQSGNLTMALPVAFKERPYPRSATLDLWSKERWARHAAESRDHQQPNLLLLWVLLLLPFFVTFILIRHRPSSAAVEGCFMCFILCALASGIYLAMNQHKPGVGQILMGMLYSFAALCVYAVLSFGLLFVGCLVMLG